MDPERERMRLMELYAAMSDGELTEIAEDWESLTDPARLALKMELGHRGIEIAVDESAQQQEENPSPADVEREESLDLADPVVVAEYTELGEAMMAKGFLETGGIRCALSDLHDNVVDPNGFLQHITGSVGYAYTDFTIRDIGFRLLVSKADAQAATEALQQMTSEAPDPGDGEAW